MLTHIYLPSGPQIKSDGCDSREYENIRIHQGWHWAGNTNLLYVETL